MQSSLMAPAFLCWKLSSLEVQLISAADWLPLRRGAGEDDYYCLDVALLQTVILHGISSCTHTMIGRLCDCRQYSDIRLPAQNVLRSVRALNDGTIQAALWKKICRAIHYIANDR